MKKYLLLFFVFTLAFAVKLYSQENKNLITGIGFYNLENLFDTVIDPDPNKILQKDFTPKGKKEWTSERYQDKLAKLARTIADIGTEATSDGLAILGVSEVENKTVLDDLVQSNHIKSRGYKVVHYDSPDKRGIDVGLLYNPKYFKLISSKTFSLRNKDSTFFTRDQLLVSGLLNGEKIYVIVAHWPSRRGGEEKSRPKRAAAAKLGRMLIDSLQAKDPKAKIIYMGDLNDNPTNENVQKHLQAHGSEKELSKGILFNPWENYYKNGEGTLIYRGKQFLFDQILVSNTLLGKTGTFYQRGSAKIVNKGYLKEATGKYKGYPFRTYAGGLYLGGYSDHFPVYLQLIKDSDK